MIFYVGELNMKPPGSMRRKGVFLLFFTTIFWIINIVNPFTDSMVIKNVDAKFYCYTGFSQSTSQLGTLNITLVATENLYSDMPNPFLIGARVADSITDELISGAQVTIMAEYYGGESLPWVDNYTTTESTHPPGYYTVNINHSGAGLYNFTAFVEALNYDPNQTWIIREVKTRPTVDPGLNSLGIYLLLGVTATIFILIPLLYFFFQKNKSTKRRVKRKKVKAKFSEKILI